MSRTFVNKAVSFWLVASASVATIILAFTVFISLTSLSPTTRCRISLSLSLRTLETESPSPEKYKNVEFFTGYNATLNATDTVTPRMSAKSPTESYVSPRMPEQDRSASPLRLYNATSYHSVADIGNSSRLVRRSDNASTPTTAPTLSSRLNFTTRERGYILSLDITQQIFGALHGYTDLATLGALLGLSSVEPYIYGSSLVGVPSFTERQNVLKLSTLYDSDNLKNVLKTCSANNDHEMSTFETFLERASREVIFVYLLTSLSNRYRSNLVGNNSIIEMTKYYKFALGRLNRWASIVSNSTEIRKFYISRVFVIDAKPKKPLHLSELLDVLRSAIRWKVARLGSATLLFNNWEGIHNKPDSPTFYYIPEYVRRPCHFDIYKVNHSQTIVEAADAFALSMRDSKSMTRIGIHVRGERILNLHKDGYVVCLEKLKELVYRIKSNSSTGAQVRLIHDLGRYGTASCSHFCEKTRYLFTMTITQLRLPSVHFYPNAYTNFPKNPAFVSAVEQEYLSRMDVLVTVGSGGFQSSTIAKFMQHAERGKNHLYKICSHRFSDDKDLISVF